MAYAATLQAPSTLPTALAERIAQAPAGYHQLHEAALLWSQHRPASWREIGPPSPHRYLSLIHFDRLGLATRLARLLSGLTWAVVNDSTLRAFSVDVPTLHCHRVTRALNHAWLGCRAMLSDLETAGSHPELAAAAWRIALLSLTAEMGSDLIVVRSSGAIFRDLLTTAAQALDIQPTAYRDRITGDQLIISGRPQVQRLIHHAAGGGGSAQTIEYFT